MTDPKRGKDHFVGEDAPAPARDADPPTALREAAPRTIVERERMVAASESAISKRENALHLREEAALLREEAASVREEAIAAQEIAAKAKARLEAFGVSDMREANQNLVVAAMNAQTMTEAAEQANRLKEEFLAMLAHELRSPLAPIRNAVAILQRIAAAHPQLPWIHDVIRRQADHMTRLLDDLLDVARVTSGKVTLQRRPVAVIEFVEQAIETSRPLIDSRRQQFTLDIPPQPLYIDGDFARLTQVFSNLLNNASKYTDEGGIIALSVQTRGEAVVLRLTDNGSGIAADTLPHIFDLFAQADRALARAQGGLGIGLTVVRRLVEMHGGTVVADSAGLNQGSEFVVTLPLCEAAHDAVADGTAPPPLAGHRYKIVLIEDNVDANDVLRILLEMMGHEVLAAFDGVTGAALVKSSRPQVVLCDIGLPAMDGYEVIAKLRAEMTAPLPCMIALTGYGRPEDRTRALGAGFDHHLVKPVSPETLTQLIAAHFEPVPVP